MEELNQLEDRIKRLGMRVIEKRLARLEGRRFFLFLRVRLLLRKVRFLKNA